MGQMPPTPAVLSSSSRSARDTSLGGGIDAFVTEVSTAAATPAASISELIHLVQSLRLGRGLERSLVAKLENALARVGAGKTKPACGLLRAFVAEVRAQSAKKIRFADAHQLIAAARVVETRLGC